MCRDVLGCSYSIRNSILSVLSINYLLSAFVGKLVGKDLLVVGEEAEDNRLLLKGTWIIEEWQRLGFIDKWSGNLLQDEYLSGLDNEAECRGWI